MTQPGKQSLGKGSLMVFTAKLYFIFTGFLVYNRISHYFQADPGQFGNYKVVIDIVSVLSQVLILGTIQAVSKYVSEDKHLTRDIRVEALKVQTVVIIVLFGGLFFGSGLIAGLMNDPSLEPLLRIGSMILIPYGYYAVLIGCLNGNRMFVSQAFLDMLYSTLKALLIIGALYLGFGLRGAISGFVGAGTLVFLVAIVVTAATMRREEGRLPGFDWRHIISFELTIMAFTGVSRLLLQTDLFLLKSMVAGLGNPAEWVDYYGGAQTIAKISHDAMVSITAVVFPLVSLAQAGVDPDRMRLYTRGAYKFTLFIVVGFAALVAPSAGAVITILYPEPFHAAASALGLLAVGTGLYAMLSLSGTIISSTGRPRVTLALGLLTLVFVGGLNYALIPRWGMVGAAAAGVVSFGLGFGSAYAYLRSQFGPVLDWVSTAKILICGGIVAGLGRLVPGSGLMLLGKLAVLGLLFLGLLFAAGEISRKDLELMRSKV